MLHSTTNPPHPSPRTLAYAPPLRLWQQRRFVRRLTFLIGTLAILATICLWPTVLLPRYKTWLLRREERTLWNRCLSYTAPPTQVVYEEDPDQAKTLLLDPTHYYRQNPTLPYIQVARTSPPEQTDILLKTFGGPGYPGLTDPTLFSHERSNAYERQLLILTLEWTRAGLRNSQNIWTFHAFSILYSDEVGLSFRPWQLEVLVPTELNSLDHHVRFYAGQPDPNNRSHFTIPYEIDDRPGIIDGELNSQSQIILKVRSGPATQPTPH